MFREFAIGISAIVLSFAWAHQDGGCGGQPAGSSPGEMEMVFQRPGFVEEPPFGVSDAYLKGNIGTNVTLPPPGTVGGQPFGEELARVEVVGGDPIGVPLTITFRTEVADPNLTVGESIDGIVEWGSGGLQGTTATIDLRNSQVVTVHGSWVKVKGVNGTASEVNIGAFVTIGRQAQTDPVTTEEETNLAAGGTALFVTPKFAKYVQVFSDDPAADTYLVSARIGVTNLYSVVVTPGDNGTGKIPLTSRANGILIENLSGVNPIARLIVFWGLQL